MITNADIGAQLALSWPSLPQTEPPARARPRAAAPARARKWEASAWLQDPDKIMFVDIETTGLSRYYDELTLIGYQVADRHHVFIAGDDPGHFLAAMAQALCVVTFNGALFDLPFLKQTFPSITIPERHIDLRFAAVRVGLRGGQKAIERELGLDLRRDVQDIDGLSAVLLWHRYLKGDEGALRQLIRYNLADVNGMRCILDAVRDRMAGDDLLFTPTRFCDGTRKVTGWGSPGAKLPAAARLGRPRHDFATLFAGTAGEQATVVGIDLTGSEARPTGFCVLRGANATTASIATDDDIVSASLAAAPTLVSIDSPLSIPNGRRSVYDDDPGRVEFGIMRICERTLKRRGINVYPCLLPSMQKLTERGMRLAATLRRAGIPVIESYPGAAQDIIGIPRKGAGEHLLKQGLGDFGITGDFASTAVTHDELDAITSALVGTFFLAGRYEALTGPNEGALIIPDLTAVPDGRLAIGVSGRIGSGKTTLAHLIESRGCSYVRVSQVVDQAILADGLTPDRHTRQTYGWRMHAEKGQRQMMMDTLALADPPRAVVVDGLRFLEDRATLAELYGSRFIHVHMRADAATRARRKGFAPEDPAWIEGEAAPTEAEIDRLETLADLVLENADDVHQLDPFIAKVLGGSADG